MEDCIFCDIIHGDAPADIVAESGLITNDWDKWIAFKPLNPHAPGHVLFVPVIHSRDATEDPHLTGVIFAAASRYVGENKLQANIITSVGGLATQTVFHLHVHVIPRHLKDDLPVSWPWVSWPKEAYDD